MVGGVSNVSALLGDFCSALYVPGKINVLRFLRYIKVNASPFSFNFRLVSYERNQNFGAEETLEPEFTMTLPDASTYADVNSDSKFPPTYKGIQTT